jgi:DNA helicase HerA-like ATPase
MENGTPIEAIEAMSQQNIDNTTTVATAQVIGYSSSTGITKPRHAARPGTIVSVAPDDFLQEFVAVEGRGLEVGSMMTRKSVTAELDISGLNRHLAILAATGAGKSHTAGVIIEELLENNASIIAVDPHGDYVRMTQEKNEGYEHTDKINVLKARSPGDDETQIKVKTAKLGHKRLADIADVPSNANEQRRMIKEVLSTLEDKKGDKYTVEDILDELEEISKDKEERDAEDRERAEKLLFRFSRLANYDIFGSTDHNLEELVSPQQLTVLDLSGIPFDAQDVISQLILDRLYQAKIRNKLGESGETYEYPVFSVIEEAHNFCPADDNTSASQKLSEIAREGRKFGMFLTLITQRPSRINEDVLSQCNSMIVQRIVNSKDQNSIAKASEAMATDMIDELPSLNVGEAIITGPAVNVPLTSKIRLRKTEHGGEDIDIDRKLDQAGEDAEEIENTTSELDEEEDELNV